MATLANEEARILFFNAEGNMVLDEQVWPGSASEVDIRCRDIVQRAFALGSPALLMAHNHPSGDPRPSTQDVQFTRQLINICKGLEIAVHDHVIVASGGSISFRELGYI